MIELIVATDEHEGHWYTGEEIVRCRDCRYMRYASNSNGDHWWCMLADWRNGVLLYKDSGFCAWGEKRNDEALS